MNIESHTTEYLSSPSDSRNLGNSVRKTQKIAQVCLCLRGGSFKENNDKNTSTQFFPEGTHDLKREKRSAISNPSNLNEETTPLSYMYDAEADLQVPVLSPKFTETMALTYFW
jgi:hypothetical protein